MRLLAQHQSADELLVVRVRKSLRAIYSLYKLRQGVYASGRAECRRIRSRVLPRQAFRTGQKRLDNRHGRLALQDRRLQLKESLRPRHGRIHRAPLLGLLRFHTGYRFLKRFRLPRASLDGNSLQEGAYQEGRCISRRALRLSRDRAQRQLLSHRRLRL